MLEKNLFNVTNSKLVKSRFNTEESYDSIDLEKCYYSFKVDELKFINYASSKGAKNYKILKDKTIDILKGNRISNQRWEVTYIEPNNDIWRLQALINTIYDKKLDRNDLKNLFKVKYLNPDKDSSTAVNLYFHKDGKDMKLVLVDIHHLGIFAKKNGKDPHDRVYNKCKNYNCDIKYALEEAKLCLRTN